jgi:hypothetical protein
VSTSVQPFEIRLYGSQDAHRAFRFTDEYDKSYAKYDAFSLVPAEVSEAAERAEVRATTVPNGFELGWTVEEGQSDPDVEIISTGLYVIIIGSKLELVKYAWRSWMRGVTGNVKSPLEVRASVSNY